MSAIARWCSRHRFTVIAAWVLVLVGLGTLSQAVKSNYNNSFSLPGTGSTTAQQLLAKTIPAQAGDSDTIVWRVSRGTVRDPAVTARISSMLRRVATMPEVAGVVSPYGPRGAAQISRDGRIAYAVVNFTRQSNDIATADITRVVNAAEAARAPGLNVQLGGQAIEQTEQTPLGVSSAVGVLAAAVVLFIAFGSLLAMLLPIVTAIAGVGGGLMAIAPLTHAMNVVSIAPILGALIGLGVGIDYALFIVTRHRRGLQSGLTPEEAAVKAIDTSGRAVLFAGSTVCIALLGILVLGVSFLNGLASPPRSPSSSPCSRRSPCSPRCSVSSASVCSPAASAVAWGPGVSSPQGCGAAGREPCNAGRLCSPSWRPRSCWCSRSRC
jgi:putative drug exporter of the RND superfamily